MFLLKFKLNTDIWYHHGAFTHHHPMNQNIGKCFGSQSQCKRPVTLTVRLVHYISNNPLGHHIFSRHCMHQYALVWGVGVGLVGSNALYRAKLNWIKVWTCWVRTVLMKGIFSTFGSVKSLLLHRTGNKMRSRFLFPFKEKASVVIEEGPAAEMKHGAQGIEW